LARISAEIQFAVNVSPFIQNRIRLILMMPSLNVSHHGALLTSLLNSHRNVVHHSVIASITSVVALSPELFDRFVMEQQLRPMFLPLI
jgi:hypothetical protein